jgi:hypothetical protein
MTLAHAPRGDSLEELLGPDSANLSVSKKTAYESGIPPARERLARSDETGEALEQLERVLVESTRAEANLGLLLRGLKHLAAGAGAAQQANTQLTKELDALRTRVARAYESETVLRKRVQLLENALNASALEQRTWLDQEDAFLAELLTDHEQKLTGLQLLHDRRLAELDRALDELRHQRDIARTEVMRLIYERDAAVALLNEPIASTERTPTPAPASPNRTTLGSVKLPALKSKPAASSRPLVGYSVKSEGVAEERLGGSKLSTRPPRP